MYTTIPREAPIGIFDSGLGGLSVLRVLRRDMPKENFLYFGDSLHAPYGEKSEDEIRTLTTGHIEHLFDAGCKAVVIACNTATSAAADHVRALYPDRIILGMEPAVKPAVLEEHADHPKVLVMATESSLHGDRVNHLIGRFSDNADIYPLAAPGIVRLVEDGKADADEMDTYLRSLLDDFRKRDDGSIRVPVDSVVLGCTHFPFARNAIQRVMGYPFHFYDGAYGTSRETKRRLAEAGLLNTEAHDGQVTLTFSREDSKSIGERLLAMPFSS